MAEYVNQASGVRVSVRDEKELGEGWVLADDYEPVEPVEPEPVEPVEPEPVEPEPVEPEPRRGRKPAAK